MLLTCVWTRERERERGREGEGEGDSESKRETTIGRERTRENSNLCTKNTKYEVCKTNVTIIASPKMPKEYVLEYEEKKFLPCYLKNIYI